MASNPPPSMHHERPPLYRDATVVKWVVQVIALLMVLGTLWFLAGQAGDNLRASNVPTDYDFLSVNPGIDLSSGIDTDPDTGGRALQGGEQTSLRRKVDLRWLHPLLVAAVQAEDRAFGISGATTVDVRIPVSDKERTVRVRHDV